MMFLNSLFKDLSNIINYNSQVKESGWEIWGAKFNVNLETVWAFEEATDLNFTQI